VLTFTKGVTVVVDIGARYALHRRTAITLIGPAGAPPDMATVDRPIDWGAVVEEITAFLRERLDAAGADGYVLGVSGGVDSALAARLAVDAVGPDAVTGLVLPGAPTSDRNTADARDLIDRLGIACGEAGIEPLVEETVAATPGELDRLTVGNVRARARMILLYTRANAENLLVIGPDNRSEYLLGYFTKYGDGAADVRPLGDLYKTEVYDLAAHVDLDDRFLEKAPTAELWEGQTDEDEIGAPYEVVDAVLRRVVEGSETVTDVAADDALDVDEETARGLVEMHRRSEHKRSRPPTPGLR
jgi:NAD+ synthase